ncbi:MAG: tRNA pseudouridine13 synthase [Psychrobacter glaciei]|jgi:tRNA pseudouridine13 synthase
MNNEVDLNSAEQVNKPAVITFDTQWPKAYPELEMTASFKSLEEDFSVSEVTNRELTETGPHLYLYIEKKGSNTHWLARQLANHAKIDLKDVGYAGLKDRHAVTRQWFSLPIKNKEPDLTHLFNKDEFTLIEKGFYGVKLKRGALGGNQFRLVIRDVQGIKSDIEERLELIKNNGVPNYFGQQRFGNNNENLFQAAKLYQTGKRPRNRQKASMYFSASRSYLFNHMLAKRVNSNSWDKPIEGEVFGFSGSLRGFAQEHSDEEKSRFNEKDIHPTCALWGKGESVAAGELDAIEKTVVEANDLFAQGIVRQGMKQERRVSRLLLPDLTWQWQTEDVLVLNFELGSGLFATSVLRELGNIVEVDHHLPVVEGVEGVGHNEKSERPE